MHVVAVLAFPLPFAVIFCRNPHFCFVTLCDGECQIVAGRFDNSRRKCMCLALPALARQACIRISPQGLFSLCSKHNHAVIAGLMVHASGAPVIHPSAILSVIQSYGQTDRQQDSCAQYSFRVQHNVELYGSDFLLRFLLAQISQEISGIHVTYPPEI